MSSLTNVISICDCPITDSIFNIKNALEEQSICRVRKIFAVRYCEPGKNEPTKKHVFIWVEWINTNASCAFTARLMHQGDKSIFKLDRWDQPICTQVDKYGNAIAHAHWTARPSSTEKFLEAEQLYGTRNDDKIWSKFISLGESAEDSDDVHERVEVAKAFAKADETKPSILDLPIPKLERYKQTIPEVNPSNATCGLSLLLPEEEEQDDDPPLNQASWSEILGFEIQEPEENWVFANHSSQLSRKELYQLGCGKIKCVGDFQPEFMPVNKEVSWPFPTNNSK